jgi:conjugative relaxase-like TrwC/TraI family protein
MMKVHPVSGPGYRLYVEKEAEGRWVGTGAKILGLPEAVSAEEWQALRLGKHPETGEELRVRRIVDRMYQKPWGVEIYRAREMFDIVVSAPKTVSVMGLVDERVSELHAAAVERTWQLMEHKSGAMIMAQYHHHNSRELDPQEHTHLIAPNLAFDGEKWRALGVNNLYRAQEEITERYREHLLGELEREGYRIRYPELADVPEEVAHRFSQRSQQRDHEKQEYAAFQGVRPDDLTHKEVAVIVRNTRGEKVLLPREQMREMQLARMRPQEREWLMRVRESAHGQRERIRLSNHAQYEPELPHERWNYGEDPGMGIRVG